jgi:hypothetical protein
MRYRRRAAGVGLEHDAGGEQGVDAAVVESAKLT